MFKHILLPTDGSELSEAAVRKGIAFARSIGAKVTGFHAMPLFHIVTYKSEMLEDTREEFIRDSRAHGKKYLALIENAAAAAGVPCNTVLTTSDRLEEALSNIVGNAIEHAATGTAIGVEVRPDGEQVHVAISNQGLPIPPDVLPHIFEPFRRAKQGEPICSPRTYPRKCLLRFKRMRVRSGLSSPHRLPRRPRPPYRRSSCGQHIWLLNPDSPVKAKPAAPARWTRR